MTVRTGIIAAYAALALAAVALQVAARAGRFGLVPLGRVMGGVRASALGRLVVVVGWAWLGWHLLAR